MTGTMNCPICGSAAEVSEDLSGKHVDCKTCGRYGVTDVGFLHLPDLSADEQYHLSAVTRLAFEEGSPITLTDRLRAALDERPRPADPTEMMDLQSSRWRKRAAGRSLRRTCGKSQIP